MEARSSTPEGSHRCPHINTMIQSIYFVDYPHIHLHVWYSDQEHKEQGYNVVEICCHGCAQSLLIWFDDKVNKQLQLEYETQFKEKHRACPNFGYHAYCPNFRVYVQTIDLRTTIVPKRIRKEAQICQST